MPLWLLKYGVVAVASMWAFNKVDDAVIDPMTGAGQKLGTGAKVGGALLVGAGALYLVKRK